MPPRPKSLKCRHVFTLIAVVFFVPASAAAQTGRVAAQGTVSKTVALSVLPNLARGNVDADVLSSGNSVRITLSSANAKAPVIRVPLLVRSNSGFKISAAVESTSAELSQLAIIDVRATGALVSPEAISGFSVPPQFDLRREDKNSAASNPLEDSQPMLVITGPRVSLGGTLNSPNNALQVTVLIRLRPQPTHGWLAHVTFVATPE